MVGPGCISVLRLYQRPVDGSLTHRWPGLNRRWLGPTLECLMQQVWDGAWEFAFSDEFPGDAAAGTGLGSTP